MGTHRLDDLTWQELAALDLSSSLAIVPVGALEQHGPHLPLGCDTFIANALVEALLTQVGDRLQYFVLPTLPIGHSPEHMAFPGTVTLRAETYQQIVADVCASLAHHGFKKIVFLNGHGGNTDLIKGVSYDVRRDHGVYVFLIEWWRFLSPELSRVLEAKEGTDAHAGELETSLLLHARPSVVRSELIQDAVPEKFTRGPMVAFDGPVFVGWSANDLSPRGTGGEPSWATPDKGRRLLDYLAERICQALDEIDRNW